MTQPALSIGMLIFPRLTQLDLTGPYEVFARLPNAQVHLIARTLDPVRSEYGLTITPDHSFATAPKLDILFVPGGAGINALMEDEELLSFLRSRANEASYITSVCTGALVLAAAGLLNGYRATTHWLSLDVLEIFGVEVIRERVVIDRNRITGGGVTSGIDFGLTLAAYLYGEAVAREIQLLIEYDPAPPFQSGSPKAADPALVERVVAARSGIQTARQEIARRAAERLKNPTQG